jgi:hypothetical protein
MNSQNKQDFIRQKAIENQSDSTGERIYWSRHAITYFYYHRLYPGKGEMDK